MKTMALTLTFALWCVATVSDAADSRPNIIVFYTDDHGHADLSCQGVLDDIKTPHVDALAKGGVLARHGYSTAPQCIPSRAGLMVGKFQSRFGVEANGRDLSGFNKEVTIAERLQDAGYVTAQFGKWHLGPGPKITDHGFRHVFNQNSGRPFASNITLDGKDRPISNLPPEMYHVDGCSRAAASLIERYKEEPFFLYVAYRAPHVPLDAPPKYLSRFPGKMPERRRQALAMLSAVDDGVGLITSTLAKHGLSEKTLIFYIGDNGAPLKIHKLDAPGGGPGWDGSLNDPLNGEKGMLSEGGMHVPFVVSWPGTIPAGQVYDHPISALDVAATAAEIARLETQPADLDGVNLIPHLTGKKTTPPHEVLTWRWVAQSAIREGNWKLLRGGEREYLYDLEADLEEKHNLAAKHPEIATRLRTRLSTWANELDPPGLASGEMSKAATGYFDFYLDGKPASQSRVKPTETPRPTTGTKLAWQLRNGELKRTPDGVQISHAKQGKRKTPFLTRNGLNLAGPVTAKVVLKTTGKGEISFAWRTSKEKEFTRGNRMNVARNHSTDWQTLTATLPGDSKVIHVRLQVPDGTTTIKSIELKPTSGKTATLAK
ncbi:MAG TPA: aryl-sulfate sulfohydrolase [Planctomycetes bacterium]|nr:aryl-sulfate sulfohydrolase [Planctomycetaceae bacterium]HIK90511.1 aryl-sulfate sulfohydrolase [Planctomycetota bacterium]